MDSHRLLTVGVFFVPLDKREALPYIRTEMNAKYYIAGGLIILIAVCGFLLGKCAYQKTPVTSMRLVHDTLRIQDTIPAYFYIPKTKTVVTEIFTPDTSKNWMIDSLRREIRDKLGTGDMVAYQYVDTANVSLQTWYSVREERFYNDIEIRSTDTTKTETTNISTGHGWLTDLLYIALGIAAGTVFSIFFLR